MKIVSTFDGKNRPFLNSFKTFDIINVPKKSTTDIRNTFGTGSGLSQSLPILVPFSVCQIKYKNVRK